MRYFRYLSVFLLAFCVCLSGKFSIVSNAVEFEYNQYPLGLTYEEIQEFKVDENVYIIPMPDVDVYGITSNLDYTIDEQITLSNGVLYDYRTSLQNGSGSVNIGDFVTVTSGGNGYLTLTLYNAGLPLFSENGVFNFMIQSYSAGSGNTATITYSFTDGSTIVDNYTPTYGTDEFIEYTIENPSASLKMVEIKMSKNATMGLGIKKYGYIIDNPEVDNTKNIFELLKGFITGFFDNITNSFSNAIKGLFIPEEGYIESKTAELKEQVNDSLGLLVYPITWLGELFNGIRSADKTQAVFVFPEIKWEGLTVVPETPFDMYSFFYDNGFGFVLDICRFATSIVLVGAFLMFIQDTLRRILNDN